MLDSVVVQAITREEHADSGLRPVVAFTHLIQLRDSLSRAGGLAQLQICFGEQIKILRLVGMLGDFVGDLLDVDLGAVVLGKIRASADVVEKILIRVWAWSCVLGKRLKDAE